MGYDDYDAAYDDALEAAHNQFIEEVERQIEQIPKDRAKEYLGAHGDAIDARVRALMKEARELLDLKYSGPALCVAATAIEVIIRFLLLRPIFEGAFLSDGWVNILAQKVMAGRSAEDRKLLPAFLRQWGIDITQVKTDSGILVWEFILDKLWPARNFFVHQGDMPPRETVVTALDCASVLRMNVVGSIAIDLGFTLEQTGKWAEIRRFSSGIQIHSEDFTIADPFRRPSSNKKESKRK